MTAGALDDGWTALMPFGAIKAVDGRQWRLEDPAAVIAASPADRAVVDFDHASERDGGRSEAAGWIEEFSAQRIPGFLAARIAWTAAGRQALAGRLYRFISPSFRHDRTGRVVQIVRAGLTNRPAIAELPALAGALPEDTTEGQTMTETTEQPAAADATAAERSEAALAAATARVGELETALAAAQAQAGALEARAAELAATIDALHAEADVKERAGMIAAAAREGRVVPAMMKFLDSLSREQLAAYLAAAPVIVTAAAAALPATAAAETLTPAQQKLITTLGISREAFLAAKPAPETV